MLQTQGHKTQYSVINYLQLGRIFGEDQQGKQGNKISKWHHWSNYGRGEECIVSN